MNFKAMSNEALEMHLGMVLDEFDSRDRGPALLTERTWYQMILEHVVVSSIVLLVFMVVR
ncbi:MAG: hypothetical protein KDD61_06620 [Bdellovibrionales bacterium]|nr:hypothetical protein [Bdellovibrionales bacterium]